MSFFLIEIGLAHVICPWVSQRVKRNFEDP